MKKSTTWSEDFNSLMKSVSNKKNQSIKDLEHLKEQVLTSINSRIDKLYWKKDSLAIVKSKKQELKKSRISVWTNIVRTKFWILLKFIFSMPFIYIMIIPGLLIHLCMEIYQQVCFRIYKIPLVKPKDYFIFDRRYLPQLNWLEKINCFYCSYYNCLMSYLQEIVGRTERFWCPIKHTRRMENPHSQYECFVDYSESTNLRKEWQELREFKEYRSKKVSKKKK